MESKFFSWLKRVGIKISENKPQFVVNPSEFYLICSIEGYHGKYDGKTHTVSLKTLEECNVRYSVDKKNWSEKQPEYRDVCEVDCYVQVSRNKRVEEARALIHIIPRELLLISGTISKEYDGNALKSDQVVISGDGLAAGDVFVAVAEGTRTIAGRTENTIKYSFQDDKIRKNYNIEIKTGEIVIEDRKVKYPILIQGKNGCFMYDGQEHIIEGFESNEFMINGCSYTVTGITASASACVGTVSQSIDGEALVIDSFGNNVTDQFEIVAEPGILQIIDRIPPFSITIQAKCAVEKYDGTEHVLEEEIDRDIEINTHHFRVFGVNMRAAGVHAGFVQTKTRGSVVVMDENGNDVSKQFSVEIIPGNLTILPREIKIISASETRQYDGRELENTGVVFEGDGFCWNEEPIITFESSQCIVGKCKNVFTYKLPSGVNAGDYRIETEYGTLEVTDRKEKYTVGCCLKSIDVLYDSKLHYEPGTYEDFFEIRGVPYRVCIAYGSQFALEAGTYPFEITDIDVFDSENRNVTDQFNVDIFPGSLTVLKRMVHFTSGDARKEYDGTLLSLDEITISGDGFAEGEGAEFTFSGKQVLPGTSDNEFAYTLNSNTSDKNYCFQCSFGQLTVIDRVEPIRVDLIGESRSFLYDGEEKELPEFDNLSFEFNGNGFSIIGVSNCISAIDEGEYCSKEIDNYTVLDKDQNDVTRQFELSIIPGILTIEHNPAYDPAPEAEQYEQIDEYDIAVHEILQKMTGKKTSEGVKKFSKKELADLFEDNKELLKGKGDISPKYETLLVEREEHNGWDALCNKIARGFKSVTLLSEIEISDREFDLLMYYFKKRYIYVKANERRPFVDMMFTVAMVQIGIRYYENNFWPQVCKASGIESIEGNHRNWVGGSVTETLLAFGKPVYGQNEYVTNIMMHCFITDSFAKRFFDYLFQYYRLDLERNLSELQDVDLEYLCKSIINPYAKRQQLLSDYAAMSIRADRAYCKGIIAKSLTMIDCSFWEEEYPEDCLTGRLAERFEEWKESSTFYQVDKRKYQKDIHNGNGIRKYRKPHMTCDLSRGIFHIILPSQMVPASDMEDTPDVTWFVVSKSQRQFSCELVEGFSGYRTKQIEFEINANTIFDKYIFLLFADKMPLRSFVWNEKQAQFFTDDGRWMAGTQLEEGRVIAFVSDNSKIESSAIRYKGYEYGISYYELQIQEGDFVCVQGEENYYVGKIPKPGLSQNGAVLGVRLSIDDDSDEIMVYEKHPEIVIDMEENQFYGTAIIVNGAVNKLSQMKFVDVKAGRISAKKYYFVRAEELKGIREGYNHVVVDYPKSLKRLNMEYFLLTEFLFEFPGAPFIYQKNAVLKINRKYHENIMYLSETTEMQSIKFRMSDLVDGILSLDGEEGVKLFFDVPLLLLSWDRKEWSYKKPKDIWHSDLNRIFYLKYPLSTIGLFVDGQQDRSLNNYKKRADGVFECDITKLMTYFSKSKMLEGIVLKAGIQEIPLFKILQKSFLVNAVLTPDYVNNCIEAKLDLIGKAAYYADLYCEDEIVAEKEPVSNDGLVSFHVEIETADYTIKVYETEDDFGFDEDYDFVGEKSLAMVNPADLIGGCMKIINILKTSDQTFFPIDNNYRYLIYLEEQYSITKYKAVLVGIFHEDDNIMYASNAIVEIPDMNKAETIVMERLNENNKIEAFCYNHKKQAIIDSKYMNNHYQITSLDKKDTLLQVEYISPNSKRKNKAVEWISKRKERSKKKFSIWKD